jgi:tetrahydromethanopterin S-methyltransferase subunit A
MTDQSLDLQHTIVGDVVFGGADSPVAVCTLATRRLLPLLAGRPEIAVAGRVFTENVGIERMVQNLVGSERLRYLIVCGRESRHRVGQTIVALHRNGLDDASRVVGSDGPEPLMPNLTQMQLRAFQERVVLVDLIGEEDAEVIAARARQLVAEPRQPNSLSSEGGVPSTSADQSPVITAWPEPADAWVYDPTGFFLVFVDRMGRRLRVEQYNQERRLVRTYLGKNAEELCHTIVRDEQVTLLAHAAYLGRELAKAEVALRFDLEYEQDSPLRSPRPTPPA